MVLQGVVTAQGTPIAAGAVRDTIATIVRNADYDRAFSETLWSRIIRWIAERLDEFLGGIRGTPGGRYVTIGLLVFAVLLVLLRVIIGIRAEQAHRRLPRSARVEGAGSAMLADAERLAASGDYTAAAHALFAALLAACAARGEFRLHASKTTGDYARDLMRRASPSLTPFQAFRGRYDRVIYGDLECSPDDYAVLAREAGRLIMRERAA